MLNDSFCLFETIQSSPPPIGSGFGNNSSEFPVSFNDVDLTVAEDAETGSTEAGREFR